MSVPRLRFKDSNGLDFTEWKPVKLGQIVNITSGNSPSSYELSEHNIYPFLKVEDLNNSIKYQFKSREYCSSNYNIVPENSVIFPKRGMAILNNKVRISSTPVLMDTNLMALTPKYDNLNAEFLFYNIYNYKLYRIADTSSIPQINNKHILPLLISLPLLEEQTKIATFLTAVDTKIAQLSKKVDLLESYKKGAMQKIFSQEIRFEDEDGNEFPEWEVIDLGAIASKVNLKNRNLDVDNVLTNSAIQGIISQNDYFDRDIANKNNLDGYYVVEKDDFVYNPRISAYAPVGPIKRNKLSKGVMSPLYTVFRIKANCLDFFECFFETTCWHDYMKSISNFGARHDRMNITNDSFFALPILLPSEQEQVRISNFLTAIDDKISQTKNQLDYMKTFKKGLLQQMFV